MMQSRSHWSTHYQVGKRKENALATAPRTEIANEMIQHLGCLQIAKCTESNIFNSTDEVLVAVRHDSIMNSEVSPLPSRVLCLVKGNDVQTK